MTEDEVSREVSRLAGLDPNVRFCAHAYERRWSWPWVVVWIALDAFYWRCRGERGHCRRVWREEHAAAQIVGDVPRVPG